MGEKQQYSDEMLKKFENILLEKKEKTFQQIETFNIQLKELTEGGKDENSLDYSTYEAQIDYLASYKARNIKHLSDIEKALYRIKNKSYGICVVSGKLIDENRLMAVPTTTKSIEAKQQSK